MIRKNMFRVSCVLALAVCLFVGRTVVSQQSSTPSKTTIDGIEVTVLPASKESAVPAGMVIAYAGGIIPNGWLLCDGSYVKIDKASSRLAVALSTAFGGDGKKYFRLPDLRGRTVIGLTNMGTQPPSTIVGDQWARTRGESGYGGVATHSLSLPELPSHDHPGSSISSSTHNHRIAGQASINHGKPGPEFSLNPDPGAPEHITGINGADKTDGHHTHVFTIAPQGGQNGTPVPFSVVQPSAALNYLIKY